jgi:putative ABC transport system permease protein
VSSLSFDLVSSIQYLRRKPLLILLAVGTLGVGLGVASTLFGVFHALVLRPLPLDREKEVQVLRWNDTAQDERSLPLSIEEVHELLEGSPTVAAFGALRDWGFPLLQNGSHMSVDAVIATPGIFEVFRVVPHLGRLYTAADDHPGRNHVVVISFDAWQSRFGGDPEIVGRTVTLGHELFTVIGVLPEEFTAPTFRDAELWAPLSVDPDYGRGRTHRSLTAYARLTAGHSVEQLGTEVRLRGARIVASYGTLERSWVPRLTALIAYQLGSVLQRLAIIGLAVGLLLIMACVNLGTVVLGESLARRTELGLRAALGGSTARLFLQLLLDNVLLCLTGGAAAVAIAAALLSAIRRFAAAGVPRFDEVRPDGWVVLFALTVCLIMAVVFAALSVWWSSRGEPAEHIRLSGRSFATAGSRRLLGWLVASQIAFELVLLSLALVFALRYYSLATVRTGFDEQGLLLLRVRTTDRMSRKLIPTVSEHGREDLAGMAGASGATIASAGPMFGPLEDVDVTSAASDRRPAVRISARYANVDPHFLDLMRIPVLAGRGFTPADDARHSTLSVIVSRSAAARLYPRDRAVGRMLLIGDPQVTAEIIGIAGDTADARFDRGGGIDLYLPFAQDPRASYFMVIRGTTLRAATERLSKSLPGFMLISAKTLEETIENHLVMPKLQMTLMLIFGIGAAVLAVVAVYGMVTLSAARRKAEMGLRLALGATPWQLRLLLIQGVAVPLSAGIGAGLAMIVLAAPRVRPLLGEISLGRPLPIATAIAAVMALAFAASWRSVYLVAKREPADAMRSE